MSRMRSVITTLHARTTWWIVLWRPMEPQQTTARSSRWRQSDEAVHGGLCPDLPGYCGLYFDLGQRRVFQRGWQAHDRGRRQAVQHGLRLASEQRAALGMHPRGCRQALVQGDRKAITQ